ncbi:MAG: hypothetical protein HY303_07395 [Candidatus Wallbacteria bacterium]|nr:hypothetical protein [Candidatus Wallbacteria bacterium]
MKQALTKTLVALLLTTSCLSNVGCSAQDLQGIMKVVPQIAQILVGALGGGQTKGTGPAAPKAPAAPAAPANKAAGGIFTGGTPEAAPALN